MQQTEKYQLNLIEMDDTFSPAALNENAQKTEAAIEAARAEAAAACAAGDAALEQRVLTLESKPAVAGTYVGNNSSAGQFISTGFTPSLVLTHNDIGTLCMTWPGHAWKDVLTIEEGGFRVKSDYGWCLNSANRVFAYIVFG